MTAEEEGHVRVLAVGDKEKGDSLKSRLLRTPAQKVAVLPVPD